MIVSVVTPHIAPSRGYGGPAESVATLIREWRRAGARVRACSSDASIDGALRAEDVDYVPVEDVILYNAPFWRRWAFGWGAPLAVWRAVRGSDTVYINGIGQCPTTLAAIFAVLLRKPFVVASRGGLVPEHWEHVRANMPHKWLFYRLFTIPTVRRARAIHVTSDFEAAGARAAFPDVPVTTVPNGIETDIAAVADVRPPVSDGIVCLYAGRLSTEKGILGFLKVWLDVARPGDRLLVAGEGANPYADEVRALARQAGEREDRRVEFLGWLDRPAMLAAMDRAHFVALPSGIDGNFRENFGNAVAEGLARGALPLVTDMTVWTGLTDKGMGFAFGIDAPSIATAIRGAQGMDAAQFAAASAEAKIYARDHLSAEACARSLLETLSGTAPT